MSLPFQSITFAQFSFICECLSRIHFNTSFRIVALILTSLNFIAHYANYFFWPQIRYLFSNFDSTSVHFIIILSVSKNLWLLFILKCSNKSPLLLLISLYCLVCTFVLIFHYFLSIACPVSVELYDNCSCRIASSCVISHDTWWFLFDPLIVICQLDDHRFSNSSEKYWV